MQIERLADVTAYKISPLTGAVSLLCLFLFGCGTGGKDDRVSVSGTVIFGGKPLDHGTIQFEAVDEKLGCYSGGMIEGGKFDVPADKGLRPGDYRIRISSFDTSVIIPRSSRKRKKNDEAGAEAAGMPGIGSSHPQRIPEKFNTKSEEIVSVVKGKRGQFDFAIE